MTHRIAPLLVALLAVAASATVHGGQVLVRPGDRWDEMAAAARPGDEIVLMPGEHRPGSLSGVAGTPEQPIVIRSLDADHAVTIRADRVGIRLQRVRNLVLQDVIVEGASLGGIEIGYLNLSAPNVPPEEPTTRNQDLTLRRVTVKRTGPKGQRHALYVGRTDGVLIEDCSFEGWGGSAIEVFASTMVKIAGCTFVGVEDHTQLAGVRIRGMSERIAVTDCRFENAGTAVLSLGASSSEAELRRILPPPSGEDDVVHEASAIDLRRNLVQGGACALALFSAAGVVVEHNTIAGPGRVVIALSTDADNPRIGSSIGCRIANNLVVWDGETLERRITVGPGLDPERALRIEENLWWSPKGLEEWERLGPLPGSVLFPQVVAIDPRLDGAARPMNHAARLFGAAAP